MSDDSNPIIYDREQDDWQTVTTLLPDGSLVVSSPNPQDADLAKELGFDNVWEMCKWHDITHLRLCLILGLETSPTLMRIAHADPFYASDDLVAYEEAMVMAAARFFNAWKKETGEGTGSSSSQ